jgi:predicted transcriptional regulator
MVTKRDIITQYFFRNTSLKINTKELARVLSMNYNTTRYYVWKLKKEKIISKVAIRKGSHVLQFVEEVSDYVKKYLSTILYCGNEKNTHHGKRFDAYAYTFETTDKKQIDRSDDLYEAIRKHKKYCFEIYIDELDAFGKNFGYGVEPSKRTERKYIYPSIYVSIEGKKVSD